MENKIEARHLNLYYGQKHALKDVSLDIKENKQMLHIMQLKILTSISKIKSSSSLSDHQGVVNQHF